MVGRCEETEDLPPRIRFCLRRLPLRPPSSERQSWSLSSSSSLNIALIMSAEGEFTEQTSAALEDGPAAEGGECGRAGVGGDGGSGGGSEGGSASYRVLGRERGLVMLLTSV
jgi:hypothetical protein